MNSETMCYAGIGSREIPKEMFEFIPQVARALADMGFKLRSGGAKGTDTAFESGAREKEIFLPHHATPEAIKIAMEIHPAPHNCKPYVRKLHGRNVHIILGENLDVPVKFVICYSLNEKAGGTSLGIRLARREIIPVYNLAKQDVFIKVTNFLASPQDKFF